MLRETDRDEYFMRRALDEAREAAALGEVPIGAVIVKDGSVIARAHNYTEHLNDVTAHAEMQAITSAANYLGGKYLQGCTLYVTVEPCPMCAGAIGWAQIERVVWGASDSKRGYTTLTPSTGASSPLHPRTQVTAGVLEDECRELMQAFFKARR